MTAPAPKKKKPKEPRVGIPTRYNPTAIPLIDETVAHMGYPSRSHLVRLAVSEHVAKHHPTLGKQARRR